ncbi:MAG: hypothetical protein R3Y62_04735 [Eubacteriales bacterium]
MAAVELYIARGCNLEAVMQELGYPSPMTLRKWYKEFVETGDLKKISTQKPHLTQAQIEVAVEHYFAHGQSYTGTSRALGYPNRMLLKQWILASGRQIVQPCKSSNSVVKYTDKEKREALLLWASGWPDYKADVFEFQTEKAKLQKELGKLRFEKDVMEATMQALKKPK